jgi:hypothetical protein
LTSRRPRGTVSAERAGAPPVRGKGIPPHGHAARRR